MTAVLFSPIHGSLSLDAKKTTSTPIVLENCDILFLKVTGGALIHGQRAPLIGGIAMDALMVDVTDIPQAQMWDEAVVMGRQGNEEITVHDVARLKNSVSYDVLTSWRLRLRRKCVNGDAATRIQGSPTLVSA